MKIIISTFLILCSLYAEAQLDTIFIRKSSNWPSDSLVYTEDTVTFSTGIMSTALAGTSVIPWTQTQQYAKGFGVFLENVSKTECEATSEKVYTSKDQIDSVFLTDTSLEVFVHVYDNCCYDFLCDLEIKGDSIINLKYIGFGGHCACNCGYQLTYRMTLFNFKEFEKLKGLMIQSRRETIRKIK